MTRRAIPWPERTLGVLTARRDEVCGQKLTEACARGGIFGQGSSRTWQEAFETSYLAGYYADGGSVRFGGNAVRPAMIADLG